MELALVLVSWRRHQLEPGRFGDGGPARRPASSLAAHWSGPNSRRAQAGQPNDHSSGPEPRGSGAGTTVTAATLGSARRLTAGFGDGTRATTGFGTGFAARASLAGFGLGGGGGGAGFGVTPRRIGEGRAGRPSRAASEPITPPLVMRGVTWAAISRTEIIGRTAHNSATNRFCSAVRAWPVTPPPRPEQPADTATRPSCER